MKTCNNILKVLVSLIQIYITFIVALNIIWVEDVRILILRMIIFPIIMIFAIYSTCLLHKFGHYIIAKKQDYKLIKVRFKLMYGMNAVFNYDSKIYSNESFEKVMKDIRKGLLYGPAVTITCLIVSLMLYLLNIVTIVSGTFFLANFCTITRSLYVSNECDIQDIYSYFNFKNQTLTIMYALLSQSLLQKTPNTYLVNRIIQEISLKIEDKKKPKFIDFVVTLFLLILIYDNMIDKRFDKFVVLLNKEHPNIRVDNNVVWNSSLCLLACINYEMNNISLAESIYNYIIEDKTATWVFKHSSYHFFLIELENKVKGNCDETKKILKQKAYKKLGISVY